MDILQLQYFQTIARLENLTKASEVLYVAQPNLSVSITRLEEDLGVSLFERRRGRIRLTETGRLFLGHVDSILDRLDSAVADVREAESRADEQVRVASVIVDLLGNLLNDFLPNHPEVSFRQFHCRNNEVAEKLLNGEADLGFIFGVPQAQGLEYMEIDRCERILQLAKDHPLAEKEIVSLRDLTGQRLVRNLSRDDEEVVGELLSPAVRPELIFDCDDNRVEVSMITHGGGVSVAPVSNYLKLVNAAPELGLTCRRIRESVPPARLGMVRRNGVHLSRAALRFYEIVARFFLREAALAEEFAKSLPAR